MVQVGGEVTPLDTLIIYTPSHPLCTRSRFRSPPLSVAHYIYPLTPSIHTLSHYRSSPLTHSLYIPSHPPNPVYTSPGLQAFVTDTTGGASTSTSTVTASTGSSSSSSSTTAAAGRTFAAKYVFDDEIIRYVSIENRLKGAPKGGLPVYDKSPCDTHSFHTPFHTHSPSLITLSSHALAFPISPLPSKKLILTLTSLHLLLSNTVQGASIDSNPNLNPKLSSSSTLKHS